jgi:hypothetical protein
MSSPANATGTSTVPAYKALLCAGSEYTISLTKLLGQRITDIRGTLSKEFGDPVFSISQFELEDGTLLYVEGEHDMPYLPADENGPANLRNASLVALCEDRDNPKEQTLPAVTASPATVGQVSLPFSIVTLQVAANKAYGFSPGHTQELATVLYDSRVITHPLTDCQNLSWKQTADVPLVLECIEKVLPYEVDTLRTNGMVAKNAVFDDDKVTSRHAIVPTGVSIALSGELLQLYTLICRQYLLVLTP